MTVQGQIRRPSNDVLSSKEILFRPGDIYRAQAAGTATKEDHIVTTNNTGTFTVDLVPGLYAVLLNKRDWIQIRVPNQPSGTINITGTIVPTA